MQCMPNVGKGCWFVDNSTKEPTTEDCVCLQDTHDQHEDEYQKELKALQAKYDALYGECYCCDVPVSNTSTEVIAYHLLSF